MFKVDDRVKEVRAYLCGQPQNDRVGTVLDLGEQHAQSTYIIQWDDQVTPVEVYVDDISLFKPN